MSVIDSSLRISQCRPVLTHDELLAELKAQAAAKRFKLKDLAAHLGIAPARINEMLNDDRRIQPREMPLVAEWLGMDGNEEAVAIPEDAIPVKGIPHLGEVPGGPWQEAIRKSHHFIPAPEPGMPASAYALTVTGGSMDRLVRDGATIIIDPADHDAYDKGLYVVRNPDGEFTFKQYRENPARLVPCSSDPSHQTIPITDRRFEVVGAVIKIIYDPHQAAIALD